MIPRGNSRQTSITNCNKTSYKTKRTTKTTWIQSTNTLLQSVGIDNLDTNKQQESANDKKTCCLRVIRFRVRRAFS